MTEIIIADKENDSKNLQNVTSGTVFEAFVQSQKATGTKRGLSDIGAYNLRVSTSDILNHCNPHNACNNLETTHLVVGYVQSGKTMSFTGVLAMAKDNGYRIAVVLTGVTTNLQNQTSSRLERDLNLSDEEDWFRFIESPNKDDVSSLIKAFRLSFQPMLIIPILKHRKYIDDVASLFSDDKVRSVIGNETVLIIDDEADQASLNSYGYHNSKITDPTEEEKESATYAAILRMRSQMPANSYIQYTATPQANILITTADLLSPKSHTLLFPGEDYVGGKKFFGQDKDGDLFNGGLIVTIPEKETYHKKKNALTTMPESLRTALMMHVWAVILVIKWYRRPQIKQLTMMIHPTDIIEGNKIFEGWVRNEINLWSECLDKPEWHEDRVTLLKKFELLLPDALQFYPKENRPSFKDVCGFIADIINDSAIYRITGDSNDDANKLRWNAHHMNIIIGAQMLNRGFTVEKLATTYMPRYTTSITNADTIEQRCRFFGYKMDYIESCRVYLPKDSKTDYISYVKHEEELRAVLASCSSLKEYERRVMLSPKLRPTRLNVLPKNIVKTKLVGWTKYEKIIIGKMLVDNKNILSEFVSKHIPDALDFKTQAYDSAKYPVGETKKHVLKSIKVKDIIPMLTEYCVGSFTESLSKSMVIRYMQYLETMGQDTIDVIFMSSDKIRKRSLITKKRANGDIDIRVELFQGRSDINEPDDYCGDTNLVSQEKIVLQIHHIRVEGLPISQLKNSETYLLAIHFPEKLEVMYCQNVTQKYGLSE